MISPQEFLSTPSYSAEVVLLIGIHDLKYKSLISQLTTVAKAVGVFDCATEYDELIRYGSYIPDGPFDGLLAKFDKFLQLPRAKERQTYQISQDMWARKSSGDLVFLALVMIDCFSTPVPSVKSVTSTDNTDLSQVSE